MLNSKRTGVIIGTVLSVFLVAVGVAAWTGPTQQPPGGNIDPPIDTSDTPQVKDGALGVEGVLRGFSSLFVDDNVGIGTTSPEAKLHVDGDIIAADDVGIGTISPQEKLHVDGNIITDTPSENHHAATKGYVDAMGGGGV